ncbi:serine hydrolase domain-containing protein [Blastococcus jejuensis]|uniref:Serine hydrolase domain-containing protein n=1 Tax=Blastococcus jejuensis TaxID=351224 RepID=A0ABP6P5V1_9ACTN
MVVELAAARAAITALMARHHVPGLSVAVTDSTGLLHAEGFGLRELATRAPATPDTSYLWFSMSKIATATAAMRLVDEGRLDLDAPVDSLVPGFRARRGLPPVVRQLLDHTSGAPNPLPLRWVLPTDRAATEAAPAAAALLARHGRPRRAAGGPARYSNVGYLVLAEVIAAAAGQPFEDYVREAVLEPAGMSGTGYARPDAADSATGYVRLPRPLDPLLRAALPRGVTGPRCGGFVALESFRVVGAGYGGLVGSVTDAARLARLHLGDGEIEGSRVLRPETAQRMRDIRTPGRPFDLGLGWFRQARDRGARPSFVEHWGTGGGFWNAMRIYPGLDLGIVVMANTTRPYDHHALMKALREVFRP